jgi:predicted amino acid-binding ACT domain protein
VFEREDEIGGQVRLMRDAPGQSEIAETLVRNYDEMLRSPHVELRLGTAADIDRIGALAPDLVVVATGAVPYRAPIPCEGIEPLQAWDVLRGGASAWTGARRRLGRRPSRTPLCRATRRGWLQGHAHGRGHGRRREPHSYRRALYLARLYRAGVQLRHHMRLVEVTPDGGLFANLFASDIRELIHAGHVVLAQGRVPAASPYGGLRELGLEVRRAGDCASPRSLEEAILEGTMAVVAWAEGRRPARASGPNGMKVALVTGASCGIGAAITERFAQAGVRVVGVSRTPFESNLDIEFAHADVSNPADVKQLVEEVVQRHERLDVVVNNAAIEHEGTVVDTTPEEWDHVMGVNLRSVFPARSTQSPT